MTAHERSDPSLRRQSAPDADAPPANTISILVVDDDPATRGKVLTWLRAETDVSVVGDIAGGMEAVKAIEALRPDLVVIDVAMAVIDGFQVLERAAPVHAPLVIVMTAERQHAARAFDLQAIDYLVKPIAEVRFREAVGRARWMLAVRDQLQQRHETLRHLVSSRSVRHQPPVDSATAERSYLKRFAVRDASRFLLVSADQVDWIDSAANYVRLHVGTSAFLIRTTMNELEQKLDPHKFARIHRSTIVNISRVKEVTPDWHGEFEVKLADGHTLRLTRTYRHRLLP